MPECRICGVALDWHEYVWCAACWEATEREDDDYPLPEPVPLSGRQQAHGVDQ